MPWKELSMCEQRLALIHRVVTLKHSVREAAQEFGVSRKTANKWLKRYREEGQDALEDCSRRPHHTRGKTSDAIEEAVLGQRKQYGWGPRKIHRLLQDQKVSVPSIRTVANILSRCGCVAPPPPPQVALATQHFERPCPNDLWQLDHKGPIEVARQKVSPLSVVDDHSRYCLCFRRVTSMNHQTTWNLLWELFGEYGMPAALLCDNFYSAPVELSWFDMHLVRLGIQPIHGRSYHPQTQGKVERFQQTAKKEMINFNARRESNEWFDEDAERYRIIYNTLRPHEALGDLPPVTRWRPSSRKRPDCLPEVSYASDAITRRVSQVGDFRYQNARIVVGRALMHQTVRIQENPEDIYVYYSWKRVRVIPRSALNQSRNNKMV